MSTPSDFPEDQDDYVSHEDYVQGLEDRIKSLEKVVEAARKFIERYMDAFGLHDSAMRGELINNFISALKQLDGE